MYYYSSLIKSNQKGGSSAFIRGTIISFKYVSKDVLKNKTYFALGI